MYVPISIYPVVGRSICDRRTNQIYRITSARNLVTCWCLSVVDAEEQSINITITPVNQKHWVIL